MSLVTLSPANGGDGGAHGVTFTNTPDYKLIGNVSCVKGQERFAQVSDARRANTAGVFVEPGLTELQSFGLGNYNYASPDGL